MVKRSFFLILVLFVGITASSGESSLPAARATLKSPELVDEISVKGVQEAKPGTLVVLEPENVRDVRTVWNLNYPEGFEEWREENGKLFLAMPNERVCFSLFVVPNDKNKPLRNIRYVLDVQGIKPEPDDVPNGRFSKSDWLVLIEESGKRSPELAKLINSKFWQIELAEQGYNKPLIHDQDSEQGQAFISAAVGIYDSYSSVPFLAIMNEKSEFVSSFPVPDSVEKLREELGL